MKNKYLSLIILVIVLAGLGIVYFTQFHETFRFVDQGGNLTYNELISYCEEYEFPGNLKCVNHYLKKHYEYVVKDDDVLSFDVLMSEGGDCANWSNLWGEVGESFGYSVQNPIIQTSEDSFHTFEIISSYDGYCTADLINLNCFIH